MALGRADTTHPVDAMKTTAPLAKPPVDTEPSKPAKVSAPKKAKPRAKKAADVKAVAATQRLRAVPDTDPDVAPSPVISTPRLDIPSLPPLRATPVATVARRAKTTVRDKHDTSLSWKTSDLEIMTATWLRMKPIYRTIKAASDPQGQYRLTLSALLSHALNLALDNPGEWLGEVPNDARMDRSAPPVPRRQAGLVWPKAVSERLDDSCDLLMAHGGWPEGFRLTKANLAATGILWALERVDDWIGDAPNDDRFSEPVDGDGRLKQA